MIQYIIIGALSSQLSIGIDVGPSNASGGSDTLGGLSCASGEIAKWNGTAWACAVDNNDDTLGGLSCASGDLAIFDGANWQCDTVLGTALDSTGSALGDVLKSDGAGSFNYDPDSDTLGGLSCASGDLAAWNGAAWICSTPGPSGGGAWTRITETTAARTAADGEFILVDVATCIITLPAPVDNVRVAAKVISSTVTNVQIRTSGAGVLIDGTDYSGTGLDLKRQYEQISVISDGTNWWIY